ncbi:MAG: Hpt domain-containing protein [Candidatus Saccharicenans sp.]|jgi:HPt (histidine-containing phosphotransfer) domain-containing protein|nr:Hpt domain-containing protein [Candidatus Saccharicenans sp.]MDH7492333.1 Hpt domain-containing protein [Candidatus Saccharicenans sp.]
MPGVTDPNDPINREEVLERIGGDEAFLKELLNIYNEEFNAKYQELEKAIQDKNFQNIREAGHYLKGAAANLSLPGLREASWKMEQAGQAQDLEAARQALRSLKNEYQRLREYLGSQV